MAVKAGIGRKIWVDGFHVSCDLSMTDVSRRQETLDVTSFCSSGRRRIAGLQDFNVTLTGYRNVSTGITNYALPTSQQIEPVSFNRLVGKSSAIVTIAESSALDSACYIAKGCGAEVNQGGRVGEVIGITAVVQGNGPLIPGRIVEYGNLSSAIFSDGSTAPNVVDLLPIYGGNGLSTKWSFVAAVHVAGSTGAAGVKKKITIMASSDAVSLVNASSIFIWAQGTIDNTTSPGTAKYATLRVSSTKLRYVRITQKSSASSTNAKFKMAIAVGVSKPK